MTARRRDSLRIRPADNAGLRSPKKPRQRELTSSSSAGYASESMTALPQWMRLYLYGMHGVTLDIVLSSIRRFLDANDLKLLGFSSPYLCVVHSLTHFVLEKVYMQKKCFQGRPVIFHFIFYPSLYIGLQILIGNIFTITDNIKVVSATQLVIHYILALYFTNVFHKGILHLQYQCPEKRNQAKPALEKTKPLPGLPGILRFVFYGMQGLLDEIVFTSVFNLFEKSDQTLSGHTSVWSFLMYGSCSFVVEKLYMHLHFERGWNTWMRLPIYIVFIYTWEFSWGLALRHFDACSWDYSHYPLNFMGLVTLLYLPGWVCLSLYQDILSNVLLRVVCTKEESLFGAGVNGRPLARKAVFKR
ncbi:transmembrane protein 229A [Clupea harengus]|uniref:Transmembrane protein 229A n=1 Tax=Clupea harengus TaxID=7950 RepID=A0A6P3VRD8_CLUHA|nr:transmembrane protein 229A [Clupea harengus]